MGEAPQAEISDVAGFTDRGKERGVDEIGEAPQFEISSVVQLTDFGKKTGVDEG